MSGVVADPISLDAIWGVWGTKVATNLDQSPLAISSGVSSTGWEVCCGGINSCEIRIAIL